MALRVVTTQRAIGEGEQALNRTERTVVIAYQHILQTRRVGDTLQRRYHRARRLRAEVEHWPTKAEARRELEGHTAFIGVVVGGINGDHRVVDEVVVAVAIGAVDLFRIDIKGNHRGVVDVIARIVDLHQGGVLRIADRAGLGDVRGKGLFGVAGVGLHLALWAKVDGALVKNENDVIIASGFIDDDTLNDSASRAIAGGGKIEFGRVIEAEGFGIVFIGGVGEDVPDEAAVLEVASVEW